MADDDKSTSALGRFQSRQGGGEQAGVEKPTRRVELPIFDPKDLTKVPGIVGRLTDWITGASLYPNRRLALGASLVIVGTLMGQRVAGPTNGSTHLYMLLLAASSTGKQQLIDCFKEALSAIGALVRVGPDDFRSSVGLINKLKTQSVFCSAMDEYGQILQRVGNKGAGGFEQDLISILQQLWGHNWSFYHTPAAAHDKSKAVFAPAVSILGTSIPEQFYGAVSFKQISGGLLNRHLIIRGDDRPPLQDRAKDSWKLPPGLEQELKAFYQPKMSFDEIMNSPLSEIKKPGEDEDDDEDEDDEAFDPEIRMAWGPGAKQVWIDLISQLREETDDLRRNLFARVGEISIRIATIIAFGRGSLTVDQIDMEWARALTLESAESLHRDVLKYTVDLQDFPGLCQKILKLAGANGGWISKRDVRRGCQNFLKRGQDLDGAISYLIQAERLRLENRSTGGRPSPGYAICE
jgi:hypothetical protein